MLIAGSIGPLGIGAGDYANCRARKSCEIYREQALALEERGVDLFILETFSRTWTCC